MLETKLNAILDAIPFPLMLLLTCIIALLITYIRIYFERKFREPTYDISKTDNPEVLCIPTVFESIARIDIIDTYILKGEKYYTLLFELKAPHSNQKYKSPQFDLSETEYNHYFGSGNDAFKTTVYKLCCETTVLTYRENTSYSYYERYISNKKWDASKIYIGTCEQQKKYKGYLWAYRFSVFGEQDFTNDEIEKAKELLIPVCKEFASSTTNHRHLYQ